MKILFFVHGTMRADYFDGVIGRLVDRGHTVRIALKVNKLDRPTSLRHPRVSTVRCPTERADDWRDLARPVRLARDYLRFFDPRFAHAAFLRRQARRQAHVNLRGFKRYTDRHAWVRRARQPLGWALKLVEGLMPSDATFEAFLRAERPDVVLVTPLIAYNGYQTEYIKSAHRLGIPIGFVVFSWDNLTSRGLIRIVPDRVLVWNETQWREVVELHGVPPERVVVTGAPGFDGFFATRPSMTREEFCARMGLDPAHPYILYLGSASFVADHREVNFVRRWVGQIRRSPDPVLRTCGVLVRPHPRNDRPWDRLDVSDLPNVALSGVGRMHADPGLYESIFHAASVVGLNTTAMIEAAILGKPVQTIIQPEFVGQEGTVHFDYLLRSNGGLVEPVRDFETHRDELAAALRSDRAGCERSRRFAEGFIRPYGLDVPASSIVVRAVEELGAMPKRPGRPPLWHHPVRWAVRACLARWLVPAMVGSAERSAPEPARPISPPAPAVNGAAKNKKGKGAGAGLALGRSAGPGPP